MSHRAGEAKQRVGVGEDSDDVYRRYLGEATMALLTAPPITQEVAAPELMTA